MPRHNVTLNTDTICKALAYAIVAIERLPDRWQEKSDKEEMCELLTTLTTNPDYFLVGACSHLERRGVTVIDGQLVVKPRDGTVVPLK